MRPAYSALMENPNAIIRQCWMPHGAFPHVNLEITYRLPARLATQAM